MKPLLLKDLDAAVSPKLLNSLQAWKTQCVALYIIQGNCQQTNKQTHTPTNIQTNKQTVSLP